ncbi:hypothetical protein DTO212C5_539 [Paecilomyces variotii]|nr:hypothetical protein DTO212C5_539 [Paecilomyces variotii]
MAKEKPRRALNALWEDLEGSFVVAEKGGVVGNDILKQLRIKVHPLEINPCGSVSMTIDNPPFLFEILPDSELRKGPLPKGSVQFREYLEPSQRPEGSLDYYWRPEACAREVSQYITYFARRTFRKLPKSRQLSSISHPDPFLLWGDLDRNYGLSWSTHVLLEAPKSDGYPIKPHITMTTVIDRVGQDGSIFYEELAPLVAAMRNRANQPEVPPEQWESLLELLDIGELPDKRVFRNEKIFPVLMLSFLGPQHARVFYARMNGNELVIGQSKLYSFERKNDANIELFARLLLSTPISIGEWQRTSEIR